MVTIVLMTFVAIALVVMVILIVSGRKPMVPSTISGRSMRFLNRFISMTSMTIVSVTSGLWVVSVIIVVTVAVTGVLTSGTKENRNISRVRGKVNGMSRTSNLNSMRMVPMNVMTMTLWAQLVNEFYVIRLILLTCLCRWIGNSLIT